MAPHRLAIAAAAAAALLAGCGGGADGAPEDASIEDFCAAKDWLVVEGMERHAGGPLPADDALAELTHDWGRELARVGTPDNISPEARAGFEKLVERLEGMDAGDVGDRSLNWDAGDWENDEETSFARYVANTCP